ncbi:uncharacterized protein K489DRAFT_222934 [Dissoconium aciculare CBS 342.82]|uniref:Uncharacterized protein n=1 Tax=Dissoconium aciculare CBS 342.82 TaxID=1314786 RepID=A0A6J3M644_9PEZI|nr:uncharacterized protein K489DRAFT_222934 [Dissoconium aciculare CBS 342.82]KAF1823004.1 hypothetical protein K489DRAFT_222934 [Dissoconium aciculare CBS 342.82]
MGFRLVGLPRECLRWSKSRSYPTLSLGLRLEADQITCRRVIPIESSNLAAVIDNGAESEFLLVSFFIASSSPPASHVPRCSDLDEKRRFRMFGSKLVSGRISANAPDWRTEPLAYLALFSDQGIWSLACLGIKKSCQTASRADLGFGASPKAAGIVPIRRKRKLCILLPRIFSRVDSSHADGGWRNSIAKSSNWPVQTVVTPEQCWGLSRC